MNLTLEHFRNLPEEKQQQIIDSVILEFAQFGYDGASTNRMVEKAGISKGVLFKYFTSKEKLFLYVCRYLAEHQKAWLEMKRDQLPNDFFDILRFYALRDLEYVIQEPIYYNFMEQITKNRTHRVYQKAMGIFEEIGGDMFTAIMSTMPSEDLREGVTVGDAMNLILWVFNGFNQTMGDMVNGDFEQKKQKILSELDKVLDLLKYGIYKR